MHSRPHHRSALLHVAEIVMALTAFAFFVLPASAATFGPGDLVKLADDHNPNTTADSAVYYVGNDGKRYAFPNSQAYFTWYPDFSGVKVISAQDMASMQLGGNVTYRPGTRLVKITSDPHVYAVEPNGVLRWVQTEDVATTLYGAQWNKRVDDIPDAFFFNYTIGPPLTAATYPNGSIVKRTSDGAYFRIENGTKRKVGSDAVRAALRIQDQFVLTASGDLSAYPDGSDIANAEPAITDTAQKTTFSAPSVPTFAITQPASDFFGVSGDVTFLEIHVSSLNPVTIRKLTVKIDATTNNPTDPALDDDLGGLVYGNNARANFTNLRFLDSQGMEPFGAKNFAVDVTQDQSQTFTFEGSYAVPAGAEKILYLVAHTNPLLPNGEGYKATLVHAGTEVLGATGTDVTFAPEGDAVGPTLSSLNATMELHPSDTPGNQTYVRGATDAAIAGITFNATTVAPNVITAVTFQGYVDQAGVNGFLPGSDADNGAPTLVKDILPQVSLYDPSGAKLAGPAEVSVDGRVTFTGLHYIIAAGASAVLTIKGDIPKTLLIGQTPCRVTFDVVDPSADVTATDDKGNPVNVTGAKPNGGTNPLHYASVAKTGTVSFGWAGQTGPIIAGREVPLGTLSLTTKNDAYVLKTVSFTEGSAAKSLGTMRLEFPATANAKASVTASFVGTSLTFSNLQIAVAKDSVTTLTLYGQLAAHDGGALYGETIGVSFGSAAPLQFVSASTGDSFDNSSFSDGSGAFTVGQNAVSTCIVRYSGLTVTKDAASPSGTVYRVSPQEVIRFTVKAEPEAMAMIRKVTFSLTPGTGTNNVDSHALAGWAKIDGDFADDDGVGSLNILYPATKTPLGQGSAGHITYSVLHGGTLVTAPTTIVPGPGDAGILSFDLGQASEVTLNPGQTLTFDLELDITVFDGTSNFPFTVTLMNGDGFQWTDDEKSGTVLNGDSVSGVPISSSLTVQK